ncbi:MAG: GDP-mannose 4,6-dehydratase [Chloroflexi bacterium]|nr:GDP-mannose 4,6-dehydratase [Chloroflexota bacterium]
MRALITGIAGFCGSHLAELLVARGAEVAGIARKGSGHGNLRGVIDQVRIYEGDLRERQWLGPCLAEWEPDAIFHLAAATTVDSAGGLWELYDANVHGTINLLESVLSAGIDCVTHIACSSGEYGLATNVERPLGELDSYKPLTHYAVSKATQDLLGYYYGAANGLRIVRTRAFNVTGPRETAKSVCSSLAKQIAEVELGIRPPIILVGNTTPRRDFIEQRASPWASISICPTCIPAGARSRSVAAKITRTYDSTSHEYLYQMG